MSGPRPCPPPTLCFYPSVFSFSLCLTCTRHLVWLHICGYPVYKAWTAALFVQPRFAPRHLPQLKSHPPTPMQNRQSRRRRPEGSAAKSTHGPRSPTCQTLNEEANVPAAVEKKANCVCGAQLNHKNGTEICCFSRFCWLQTVIQTERPVTQCLAALCSTDVLQQSQLVCV